RWQLILKQALHWGAILIAMNIMLLAGVQQFMPAPATGLVLLMLLALGAFLAGLNLSSLQICFLGVAMAVAVPAIAWLKQFALFLLLGAVLLVGLGLTFWPRRQGNERAAGAGCKETQAGETSGASKQSPRKLELSRCDGKGPDRFS